jgi:hypothetical protein
MSESLRPTRARRGAWLALIVVAAAGLWPEFGATRPINPFAEFIGTWRGSGRVIGSDGHSERISCRAIYSEEGDAEAVSQSLVCASDSYRFDIHSYVVANGRDVEGYWRETTRNVTGHVTGQIEGGQFEGAIAGSTFTAQLSLKTTGRRQAVGITPQGGDIVKVDIVLSRES